MSFIPRPQEIYKHFKGNLYQIITVAEHSETGQKLVIYQAMYGEFQVYARELDQFISRVDRVKYPNAAQEFRFELQGPGSERQRAECGGPGAAPQAAANAQAGSASAAPRAAGVQAESASATFRTANAQAGPAPANPQAAAQGACELDPMLVRFLDADTYEERLNLLAGLHHRITQEMITTMAVASDIEVEDGELENRYLQLKNCLMTREKYECKRMR